MGQQVYETRGKNTDIQDLYLIDDDLFFRSNKRKSRTKVILRTTEIKINFRRIVSPLRNRV